MAVLKSKGNFNKSESESKLRVKKPVKFIGRKWVGYKYKLKKQKALSLGRVVQSNTHLLPPRVSEALGISSYSYLSRTYPPYCDRAFHPVLTEACEPPLPGVGDTGPPLNGIKAPGSEPDCVTVAQGSPNHGIVDHTLLSEDSIAQGVSSVEVRVAAPSLQFPGVFMRELHRNSRGSDIMQFFCGFPILDMLLVFTNKSFTGDAFVVFSSADWADSALKKDGEMMGENDVRVLPCSKHDYYNAVESALNDGFDFNDSLANPTDPSLTNNNLMEQPLISKSNVMADMSYPDRPLGQSTSLCENIMDHERPEPNAKNILEKDKNQCKDIVAPGNDGLENMKPRKRAKRIRLSNKLPDRDRYIVRVFGPDYFADTNVIISVFGDSDLSNDRVHIVLHPDGKPTGEVLLELMTEEDANKVLSKDNTVIGSHLLKIIPATMNDLQAKIAEQKQEIVGNDMVKESIDNPKLPVSHLQGKPEKSNNNPKVITGVLRMSNVPPSADKYDIIELFGGYQLLPENLHCQCVQNGMATGVVYVEFNSVDDAEKALSKNMSMIHSHCVELSISSKEQAIRALNGKW